MEPEGSLPHLQVPTTSPYPKPDQSSPCLLQLLQNSNLSWFWRSSWKISSCTQMFCHLGS